MSDLPMRDSVPLGEWLAVATRNLSTESVEHVREEIEEHFVSAKEEALAAGVHPHDTGLSALVSLGDPKAANRAYRKVLLTDRESKWLERKEKFRLLNRAGGAAFVGVGILLLVGYVFVENTPLLLGLGGTGLIIVWGAPLLFSIRSRRGRILYRITRWVCMVPIILMAFAMLPIELIVFFSINVLLCDWGRMRVQRKLPIEKWPDGLFM